MPSHNFQANQTGSNTNWAAGSTADDFGSAGIKADVIAESTAATGVTADGVLLKDNGITASGTNTLSGTTTISGALINSGGEKTVMIAIPDATPYTVLAANSGKIHIIANVSADTTINLPTAAAGLYYEFWHGMEAADGHDWIFNTGSNTNYFKGGLLFCDSDAGPAAAEVLTIAGDGNSNSKLQVNLPSTGTIVKMYCDGTNWFLNGYVFSTTIPAFADQ